MYIDNKYIAALYRFFRYINCDCIVCGHNVHSNESKIYYCSFTCMGYDGCFSVRLGAKVNKPHLLYGKCTHKFYTKENHL
jgi:hypothetical protein